MLKKFNINNLKSKLSKEKLKGTFESIKSQYDKDAIIYTVLLLAILGYGLPRFIFPGFSNAGEYLAELNKHKETAGKIERSIKLMARPKKEAEEKIEVPVKIYDLPYKDIPLEYASSGLINSILNIIKKNGLNIVEPYESEIKELTDSAGLKSKEHSVLVLKFKMETTYENVQNIINQIYLMDYLVRIKDVSINTRPESGYKRVNASITLHLFAKTS